MKKLIPYLCLITLLSLPTFWYMFRTGIFTMHDFHPFRQFEFNQCISAGIFPCRWAPDAGMGYGEPVFNFYGQLPYWLGQLFIYLGSSVLDSVKISFIISLLGSGLAMFIFARKYWGNWGGLISAILYLYAPYRAVDVWVRGALPESLAFIFYPLLFLVLQNYFSSRKSHWLLWFSLLLAGLILTHNLSVFMFAPFLVVWFFYLWWPDRRFSDLLKFIPPVLLTVGLTAFYLLPVAIESSLVTVGKTTQDYYDFRLHYVTLSQLFISRFWGYGGSGWGSQDGMSFSVGQVHLLLFLLSGLPFLFHRLKSNRFVWLVFSFSALSAVFLTHGKSDFLWNHLPLISFVQFPWRFLSSAAFFMSLAAGAVITLLPSRLHLTFVLLVCALSIWANLSFFSPDIWKFQDDAAYFSGDFWNVQRSSALQDFWYSGASSLPTSFAPSLPTFVTGSGQVVDYQSSPQSVSGRLQVSQPGLVQLPLMYFPGWQITLASQPVAATSSSDLGLLSFSVPSGETSFQADFTNTPIRSLGNRLSLISLGLWLVAFLLFSLYPHSARK